MPKTVFGILRTASEALDIDQIAAAVTEEHGFDLSDPELAATVKQRCMTAMYRYSDREQIVKERRQDGKRVWRLI